MASAYLRARLEERAQTTDLMAGVLDKAAEAKRDVTKDEQKLLDQWEARAAALDAEIEQLTRVEEGHQKFQQVVGRVGLAQEREERASVRDRQEPEARKSVGERFIESDAFKSYNGHGSMAPVELETDMLLEQRAAITTADLPIEPYIFAANPPASLTPLLGLIGHERVSVGAVEYIKWGVSAGNAPIVPETELKPEAAFATTTETDKLDTYAWYKAITRQALEDYPRIRSIIETKLRTGISNALESAAADVINNGTFQTVTNTDMLAGIREAIAEIQTVGYRATAVLLNPADFAALDIAAADAAGSGPTAFGNYWGLRPVAAGAVTPGSAYVADFGQAVTWFDRNVTSVFMTDSHADYFLRNQLVILAETRALFAVTDEQAIAKVTTGTEAVTAKATTSK